MALAMHAPTVAPTFVAALAHENISCPIACQSVRLTTCVVLFGADQSDVRGGNMPMLKTKGAMTMTAEAPDKKRSKQADGEEPTPSK